MGTLCAHLLLQFYIDSFETSQVFWTWSEVELQRFIEIVSYRDTFSDDMRIVS